MANVLLVDDRPENLLALEGILDPLGQNLLYAHSGEDALRQLLHHDVAVILLDVQMPELDGFEATAQIRARESGGERVPIIAMTASAMEGDRERCLDAGMDDYIAKPLRPDELDAVLERWLGHSPPRGDRNGDAAGDRRHALVDAGRIRRFKADYPEIAGRLLALFSDTTPPLLEQLSNAVHASDDETVRRLAHKLKGSCQNIGATRMTVLCRSLEESGAHAAPIADELHAAYRPTLAAIKAALGG
jgi:two-component system, sensor histidine kinase and response regulator